MKIYENIKNYFLNTNDNINDYSNQFYIKSISEKPENHREPEAEFAEPHKRDFFEIAILERHTKNIKIGEQIFDDMTNGLAVVSPFQTISYGLTEKGDNDEGYVINFKASIFRNIKTYELQNEFPFFKIHTFPLYHLSDADFHELLPIAAEMYKEATHSEAHSLEIIQALLRLFLYKIKRMTELNEGIVTVNRYEKIMAKFENAIMSGDNAFLSVNDCPTYLTECVKKVTGKSAQKIIIDYKILHAKTLLHQLDKSIAEVAYELEFNEVANFNQFFKRNVGITATQFRKTEH